MSNAKNPEESPKQDVTQQKHYTQFAIQPLHFNLVNDIGFCEGNVIKYVCRYKEKNGLEDLKKARHYLDCLIHKEETGQPHPSLVHIRDGLYMDEIVPSYPGTFCYKSDIKKDSSIFGDGGPEQHFG